MRGVAPRMREKYETGAMGANGKTGKTNDSSKLFEIWIVLL